MTLSMACSCRVDRPFSNSQSPLNQREKAFVSHPKQSRQIQVPKADSSNSNAKIANLIARRKERVKFPNYDHVFPIGEFLSHPSGVEAMLNTGALQRFQPLDSNIYRCTLPKIQLLNFEVAPVLDLRVTPTTEDCTVEMLSCKVIAPIDSVEVAYPLHLPEVHFEGSEAVERQNDRFSAFMRNHITWDTNGSEPCLNVDVKLGISLEVYTRPFNLLPISAVENPGNLIMQALMDRLVPLLLQQLLQDYDKWVQEQSEVSHESPSYTNQVGWVALFRLLVLGLDAKHL